MTERSGRDITAAQKVPEMLRDSGSSVPAKPCCTADEDAAPYHNILGGSQDGKESRRIH